MQHGVRSVRLLSAVHACQGMDAELLCRASGGASRCVCVTSLGKLLLASPNEWLSRSADHWYEHSSTKSLKEFSQ